MHGTRSAVLRAGRDVIGAIGEIAPEVLESFEVTERVAVIEVRIDGMLSGTGGSRAYRPINRMPSSDLDLAFVLSDDVLLIGLSGHFGRGRRHSWSTSPSLTTTAALECPRGTVRSRGGFDCKPATEISPMPISLM